jgi:hypothetical protein
VAPYITIPTSTVSTLTAQVGALFTDPGLLGVIVLAAALPLFFWVTRKVIGLFPKGR